MKISLRPREPPLAPEGVVAVGDGVGALAAATLRRIDAGAELHAAAGGGWLVVLGAEADLPWADGCVYVGREGRLLIPTTAAIAPHAELVASALGEAGLLVVLEDSVLRGPMPHGPVDRDRLAACT
jgi:MoxR-vWA-beta-propeller ternary system domain bpX5